MKPLRLIGYWGHGYPDPAALVDSEWDEGQREFLTHYLRHGLVTLAYMGYSPCRLCDKRDNGNLQLTDGVYTWPEGLAHYVSEHAVRLPREFVEHAFACEEALGAAEVDESWWRAHRE